METKTSSMQAADISVGFEKRAVLDHVSAEVMQGEVVAIVGPNGAGKSTLVKTLARQLKPISGTVKLGGADIWAMPTQQFASQVAYVPQDIESSTELTVEQMVRLGRNPHQKWWQWYGDSNDVVAVDKALQDTEMHTLRDKPICQLSGGERQRAAMATAIAQQPLFMFLDEPTSHLDFKHQIELLALLKTLKSNGIGIIIVLHDLNVVARIADRVILLERSEGDGKTSSVAAIGATKDTLSVSNLHKVFDVNVAVFDDPNTGETVYNPFSFK